MSKLSPGKVNRREFLKIGVTAGLGTALGKSALAGRSTEFPLGAGSGGVTLIEFKVPPIDPVRIGFVGVGGMGSAHVRNFLKIEGVEIKAVCDIVEEKVARIQKPGAKKRVGPSLKATPGAIGISSACASGMTSTSSTRPLLGSGMCRSAWQP